MSLCGSGQWCQRFHVLVSSFFDIAQSCFVDQFVCGVSAFCCRIVLAHFHFLWEQSLYFCGCFLLLWSLSLQCSLVALRDVDVVIFSAFYFLLLFSWVYSVVQYNDTAGFCLRLSARVVWLSGFFFHVGFWKQYYAIAAHLLSLYFCRFTSVRDSERILKMGC